ncbi:MAG: hypothetical protein CBD76_03845 [Pelagibacteraceae bacterium TMED216]|nr:MAG: hypothetical protein CBD76_03845 [Pelagibacteraceae bacterium TMED216]
MNDYFLVVTFFVSLILHYVVQKVFIQFKKFDAFNHRSSHNTLATKTGGISMFTSLFFILIYFYFNSDEIFDFSLLIPLGIMFIVGVYDDFYNADFKLKFLLQIIVAKILVDLGFVISNYHGFLGLYEVPWIIAQLTTIFVFLVVVNSINFIDGIDGLAITEIIKTILIVELMSLTNTPLYNLSLILICSIIPLYYFNFRKNKKIFLGDGGSLFLGSLIACYVFYVLSPEYQFKNEFGINKFAFSILIILYPLTDLLRVFIIRIYNGGSPFIADNNHIHHKMLRKVKKHYLSLLLIICSELLIIFLFIRLI